MYQNVNVPDIFAYNEVNPSLHSPNSPFDICFAQTRDTLMDVDLYRRFLYNAISRFRHSRTYKNYKSHLMQMGLDRCQVHANIRSNEEYDMATIEMHHNILTIFDVALVICEHMLNVHGAITTFDLCELLKMEHKQHHVCTVMLSKTAHQLVHSDPNFIIPPNMCFGNWPEFLKIYHTGITPDLGYKVIRYIDNVTHRADVNKKEMLELLSIREAVMNWSDLNDQPGLYKEHGNGLS